MLTRDSYVALLQKRAAEAESSIPDVNSNDDALEDFKKIQTDSREFLHGLFNHASAVESQQSAEAKKIWSGTDGTKVSGNPLMKVAMRQYFQSVLLENGLMKTASPFQKELAFNSFFDELEKIAGAGLPGGSLPGSNQALALASRNKMRATMPPKVWDLSGPAKSMGIGPKPPMGSGTTLNK